MKNKNLVAKNKIYLIAALIPWLIVLLHSVVRSSWLLGKGSLLTGDAGELYYNLYAELWEKLHSGGSLLFSWNTGGGTDFLICIFRYLLSPVGWLLMLLPKAWLADGLQALMVLKWSAMFIAMLYYLMHTKHNDLVYHKEIISLAFTMAFCLSNTVVDGLQRLSWCDVIILFPLLLLFTEGMQEGKDYGRFIICLTFSLLCNYTAAIPMSLFLVLWYFLGRGNGRSGKGRSTLRFFGSVLLSYGIASVVIIPCVVTNGIDLSDASWGSWQVLPTDLIHRLFVFDQAGFSNEGHPVLYCSVVLLTVSMFYCFTRISAKEKLGHLILLFLLILGLVNNGANALLHGIVGMSEEKNDFTFLIVFLFLFLGLKTILHIYDVKKLHTLVVGAVGIGLFVHAFFKVPILMRFYVYLGTILFFVLFVLLMYFFSKGSIQYHNMILVVALFAALELLGNAYMRFARYDEYPYESTFYREEGSALADSVHLAPGERVSIPQDVAGYGMTVGMSSVSGKSRYYNKEQQYLARRLGLGWNEDSYEYVGASPLLNAMFGVRYGMASNEVAFSDAVLIGEGQEYHLYQMQHLAGAGYMVEDDVREWNIDDISPFEVQNDFIRKATGGEDIFQVMLPDGVSCYSTVPQQPEGGNINLGAGSHGIEKKYDGLYNEKMGYFNYDFKNGFYGENINLQFVADGKTDYYVHMKSNSKGVNYIVVNGETLYQDAVPARERSYHIGILKRGSLVRIVSRMEVDNDDWSLQHLSYQFAGFIQENYDYAYKQLCSQPYLVDKWKDTSVSGKIKVDKAGIMMTGIPSLPGFSVYVDGEKTSYDKVGNALIGVPLDAGEHRVEFRYRTPFLLTGSLISLAALLFSVLLYGYLPKKKQLCNI